MLDDVHRGGLRDSNVSDNVINILKDGSGSKFADLARQMNSEKKQSVPPAKEIAATPLMCDKQEDKDPADFKL